ncbi:phosphonate metabolism transcriptional regulator PhnF [Mesorhizobium sp. B4-1-4]|uniref:phosphonate metabolism transcriptional regulator PhnF n=1 Tax=Mesorhizobium sp. B4-1-4 TaxID=2589888 RepID=UPI00112D71DC|nr:phosphonate metabolism transcriptional regulator PhnF [Mesorhizobium sp. B4-1-4]UCI31750.1 phosphonate metabolism transcriptional regulator PhnF [Mesorhizobium sp. B4-1-4]
MTDNNVPKLPLWRQVQLEIERRIKEGDLCAGDRLPPEEELAALFGVHRHTARRALARLQDKEIVTVVHGSGTFVSDTHISYRFGAETSMTAVILRNGKVPRRELLSSDEVAASREIASFLSLRSGRPVFRVRTLRLIDDLPVSLNTNYYPLPQFAGIDRVIAETGSISQALRRYGIPKLSRKELCVRASLPSVQEARSLRISRTKPLIELLSVNRDENGLPVQHVHGKIISEHLDVVVTLGD